MASRPLRPEDPRRLGAYQLVARLGEGGMGTVYLGRDTSGRHVAVKAIRPDHADQEEFLARFRSEVNRLRQVPSFCTAAVLDADPDHSTPYLVIEYVDGPSLREAVAERGPMPEGDLYSVAIGVAAALTAIHGAGVIHRDLKPTNVLLSLGLPKVIDFGIARALDVTSRHTMPDRVMGTVAYMAPERLDETLGATTQAADIFAWGAVVAYAATGHTPFGGDTPTATVARILTRPPDLTGVPEPLATLVSRALAKDPQTRPTANEIVQELLATPAPRPTDARPAPARPGFSGADLLTEPGTPQPRGDARAADARTAFSGADLLARSGVSDPQTRFSGAGLSAGSRGSDARPGFSGADLLAAPGRSEPSADAPGVSDGVGAAQAPDEPARDEQPDLSAPPNLRTSATTRRLIYAVAATLLVIVGFAVVVHARTGDDPGPAAPTVHTDTSAAPAPAPSLRGPSFFDALAAPGRFRESAGESGRCAFDGGRLRARTRGASTYQCPGPRTTFAGDQSIVVDLSLARDGSCAMIWFRYREGHGYQLTACSDQVELEQIGAAMLVSIGRAPSTTLRPGTHHKVSLTIVRAHAEVAIDGALTLQAALPSPELPSGQVLLGVTNAAKKGDAEATFTNLDVHTG